MQRLKEKWQLLVVIALILADIAAAYPVYEVATADPMANLPPAPIVPPAIQLDDDDKVTARANKVPRPSKQLYAWNPFYQPTFQRGPEKPVEDVPEIDPDATPVPTDEILLYGVIRLNGEYRALVSVSGDYATEIRKGQVIEGTDGIVVVDIQRSGVIVAQEGYRNAFVRIEQPSLEGTAWYQSSDFGDVRGEVKLRK